MNTRSLNGLLLLLFAFVIISCGGGSGSSDSENESDTANTDADSTAMQEESMETKTSYVLPSPLQIGEIFQKAGLKYIDGITNPTENATKYNTRTEKLLNFGVYSADLSYVVLNQQSNEAIDYLKTVRQMAEDLGMGSVFTEEVNYDEFEEKLKTPDSVINMLASIQEEMDAYLADNEQEHLAPVIFTGAWIEGMYFGVKSTKNEDREDLTTRLIEQMTILDNVIAGLNTHPNPNARIKSISSKLQDMRSSFNKLLVKKKKNMSEAEGVKFSFMDLQGIADQVLELRNDITKAK